MTLLKWHKTKYSALWGECESANFKQLCLVLLSPPLSTGNQAKYYADYYTIACKIPGYIGSMFEMLILLYSVALSPVCHIKSISHTSSQLKQPGQVYIYCSLSLTACLLHAYCMWSWRQLVQRTEWNMYAKTCAMMQMFSMPDIYKVCKWQDNSLKWPGIQNKSNKTCSVRG